MIPMRLLVRYGQAVIEPRFRIPLGMSHWRPPSNVLKCLTGLHAVAIRRVEGRPVAAIEAQAAHGMEQQLIHAVVSCLSAGPTEGGAQANRGHTTMMARFEDTLRAHPHRMLSLTELCALIEVKERTLRNHCEEHLGMGPCVYLRLRRLQQVHRELSTADRSEASVRQLARGYGFNDASRFAAVYRARFGEPPSATLRRSQLGNISSRLRTPH
jgi:AraC-like DNA-binding protein